MKILFRKQRGAHLSEFAIAGSIFFVMLFGAIEFGRLVFAWQTLDEASRRAARVAVVCPINDSAIANVAVFNNPTAAGESPLLLGLSDQNVLIEYLNETGAVLSDPAAHYEEIRFVRASIHGYNHTLLVPFFVNSFTLPDVATVLPRESLGVWPGGTGCFGTTP